MSHIVVGTKPPNMTRIMVSFHFDIYYCVFVRSILLKQISDLLWRSGKMLWYFQWKMFVGRDRISKVLHLKNQANKKASFSFMVMIKWKLLKHICLCEMYFLLFSVWKVFLKCEVSAQFWVGCILNVPHYSRDWKTVSFSDFR